MSAEVLREAAVAIRADNQPWPDHDPCDDPTCDHIAFMRAVADWLEDALDAHLHVRPGNYPSYLKALAVARAYLNTP